MSEDIYTIIPDQTPFMDLLEKDQAKKPSNKWRNVYAINPLPHPLAIPIVYIGPPEFKEVRPATKAGLYPADIIHPSLEIAETKAIEFLNGYIVRGPSVNEGITREDFISLDHTVEE